MRIIGLAGSQRRALLALLVLVMALAVPAGARAAAGAASARAPRAAGGGINVGIWQEPDFLNWIVGSSCFNCVSMMRTLYDPPLQVGTDGNLAPDLLSEVPSTSN